MEKALLALGEDVLVTRDREKLLAADKVILPGVGNFGDAMEAGVPMVIANGAQPAALYDLMDGKPVGTKFLAQEVLA